MTQSKVKEKPSTSKELTVPDTGRGLIVKKIVWWNFATSLGSSVGSLEQPEIYNTEM